MAELNEEQIQRYARHIVLQEVGGLGQAALLDRSEEHTSELQSQ